MPSKPQRSVSGTWLKHPGIVNAVVGHGRYTYGSAGAAAKPNLQSSIHCARIEEGFHVVDDAVPLLERARHRLRRLPDEREVDPFVRRRVLP